MALHTCPNFRGGGFGRHHHECGGARVRRQPEVAPAHIGVGVEIITPTQFAIVGIVETLPLDGIEKGSDPRGQFRPCLAHHDEADGELVKIRHRHNAVCVLGAQVDFYDVRHEPVHTLENFQGGK